MATTDSVDEELGMVLKKRIKEMGWTQEGFGKRLDPPVTQGVISQWLRGKEKIPRARYPQIAEVLEISLDDILSVVSYARTPEQLEKWRLQALAATPGLLAKVILMALPKYLRSNGESHVSEEEIAADIDVPVRDVQSCWDEVLASEFVERVGCAKWVFKLKLVEVDEGDVDIFD